MYSFFKSDNSKEEQIFPKKKKKNAILLVLLIEEISLQPKLSSPPRFRIQGGSTSVNIMGYI